MSLTVFIKAPSGAAHEIELDEADTVGDLYKKAETVSEVRVEFTLHLEGEMLDKHTRGEEEAHQLGMEQGCELLMLCKEENRMCVAVQELSGRREDITLRLQEDPETVLEINVSARTRLFLEKLHIPDNLRNLKITDPEQNVTVIEDKFLSWCKDLVTLDMTDLRNIGSIGYCFLYKCTSLRTVDLSLCGNVRRIDNHFLANCDALESVDLSPLGNVTSIGDGFLLCCKSLKELDLSPLSNVTSVGDSCCCSCTSLTAIDVSQLHRIRIVGDNFLGYCPSLGPVDLTHFKKPTTSVGSGFMRTSADPPTIQEQLKSCCECVVS
eukprot:TRINITY_DN345_c1_g1_i1.p1 TRINITY_DN345_c1_g1~~TRINITY_DN345_c1_g1_i1.p1  ORF type:complete len:346 (+),score=80.79 TRINITY_DN345_c1_g1_i1:71-1039(+)